MARRKISAQRAILVFVLCAALVSGGSAFFSRKSEPAEEKNKKDEKQTVDATKSSGKGTAAASAADAVVDAANATEKLIRVAVLVPSNPTMHHDLKQMIMTNLRRLPDANPTMEIRTFLDAGPIPTLPSDGRPLSKTARLRNRMIDAVGIEDYDYVLWIDSDVIEFPADLPTLLISENPTGVTAPLVLIEEPGPLGPNQFYDTTAFTLKGRAYHRPKDNTPYVEGRSVQLFYPYVPIQPYLDPPEQCVMLDGVGTVYVIPVPLFTKHGARYRDHPSLTEHWSIVEAAHQAGMPVCMHTGVIVRHANLPKWGDSWHANARKKASAAASRPPHKK
mmetsp:Transcript_10960/g.26359  ORF Transcript_10960/g.26359 Transcript_10960/m.26359 type:complete len:333 (+) Transcript_10960:93-1091(+)